MSNLIVQSSFQIFFKCELESTRPQGQDMQFMQLVQPEAHWLGGSLSVMKEQQEEEEQNNTFPFNYRIQKIRKIMKY